jgi:TonB family protein
VEVLVKKGLPSTLFLLIVCVMTARAQNQVAEGEYEIHGVSSAGAPISKTATRWVLTSTGSDSYHLASEIQSQPSGMRVVQVEELTGRLVPTSIGYELYRNEQTKPDITAKCELSGSIVCSGASGADQAAVSEPYKVNGPFWLWVEGLYSLDMQWLLGGAVSMANLANGKTEVATLDVLGGSAVMIGDAVNVAKLKGINKPLTVIAPNKPIVWKLSIKEESQLELVGVETLEMFGAKIQTKHYTFGKGDKPMNLWTAGPGLVVKFNNSVLANYTQYKKLIPELPTGLQQTNPTPQPTDTDREQIVPPRQTTQPAQIFSNAPTSLGTTYLLEPINVAPVVYPLSARQQNIQGKVDAIILVSEIGSVEIARVLKGEPLLAEAVESAAKQWTFKQVTSDGKAVPVISKVTFKFILPSDNRNPSDVVPEIAPATDFPKRVRVSKGVMKGLLQSNQAPTYPPEAKAARIQGTVTLQAVIDKEGKVADVQLVSGPPELAAASIDAVRQWVYRPYLFYGRPVEVDTQLQINFALRER